MEVSGLTPSKLKFCQQKLRVGYVYIEESVDTIFNMGYRQYKVIPLCRTNLKCFRRGSFSVVRRYSDFLGLHEKLVARYQHRNNFKQYSFTAKKTSKWIRI